LAPHLASAPTIHVAKWQKADDFGAAGRLSVVGGAADPLTAAIPLPAIDPELKMLLGRRITVGVLTAAVLAPAASRISQSTCGVDALHVNESRPTSKASRAIQ
jgi:sugar (pentulose or hexulose) kinase